MDRRSFLSSSLAICATASAPRIAFLADATVAPSSRDENDILSAQMIWSRESVPVPLKLNGPASGIASSSPGHPFVPTEDLHTAFAREFTIDTIPAYATLRLFAYTRYRLYINGTYIGRGPSRFQNQRPEYDTRDIAHVLKPGRNRIVLLVHRDAPTGRIMRHPPGFAALLHLSSGSKTQTIATDATWLAQPDLSFGPRDEAWSSIEEHIDARRGFNFADPSLSLADWPASVPATGPDFLPVFPRATPAQIESPRPWTAPRPQFPIALEPGKEITFDLPEIIQGYHDLAFDADAGSQFEVTYQLPENQHSGFCTYVAIQGPQTWMGGDTFCFSRLSLRLKSGRASLLSAAAVEVRYPFQRAGSFECSDPFLNRLWTICARSLELLSEDSYVDCADRERVEWTDDSPPAFDCTRVVMRGPDHNGQPTWGDHRLLQSLLRRIAATQQADGQIKAHSCSERWDIHAIMEDRSCDWIVLLREYVESSGNLNLVREQWPALKRLLQWFLDRRTPRGLVLAREWEVWDNPLRYQVCEGAGLNAMFYRALVDAAWLAEQIGASSDAQSFATDAANLHAAFNTRLWSSTDGSYVGGLFGPGSKTAERLDGKMFTGPFVDGHYQPTAQAALFALYAGIVPVDRLTAVRQWILPHLDEIKGPMSHYYLFRALYDTQTPQNDALVLDRMRSGWKLQVESPWQTTWEDLIDGGGSKVHMYGVVPGSFLTTHVLGARRVGPIAHRNILIEPRCTDLAFARGIAVTEFGPVDIKWSRASDDAMHLECTTPPDTHTTLRLYKRNNHQTVLLDNQKIDAVSSSNFIQVALPPGPHTIKYPT